MDPKRGDGKRKQRHEKCITVILKLYYKKRSVIEWEWLYVVSYCNIKKAHKLGDQQLWC